MEAKGWSSSWGQRLHEDTLRKMKRHSPGCPFLHSFQKGQHALESNSLLWAPIWAKKVNKQQTQAPPPWPPSHQQHPVFPKKDFKGAAKPHPQARLIWQGWGLRNPPAGVYSSVWEDIFEEWPAEAH